MARSLAVLLCLFLAAAASRSVRAEGSGEESPAREKGTAGEEKEKEKEKEKRKKNGEEGEGKGDEEDGSLRLSDVWVRPGRTSRVTAVISAEEVERAASATSVEALLAGQAGVDMSRTSPSGPSSRRVTIRGFDESRYAVLLGGRQVRGAGVYGGYYVDWGWFSLEDVERIEVVRGAAPVRYGDTLGGVVNVVPRRPGFEATHRLALSGGSYNTGHVQALHGYGIRPLAWRVAGSGLFTDGHLRNAFVKRWSVSVEMLAELMPGLELTASFRHAETEAGFLVYNRPDSPYFDPDFPESLESQLGGPYVPFLDHGEGQWGPLDWGDGSHWTDARHNADVGLSYEAERIRATLQAYWMDQTRDEHFLSVTEPRALIVHRRARPEEDNGGWKADAEARLDAMGSHRLSVGLEGHYLGYGDLDILSVNPSYFPPPRVPASYEGDPSISVRHGLYLQDVWSPCDFLLVEAGLRLDHFEAKGPEAGAPRVACPVLGPGLAVTLRPLPGLRAGLRYRRAARFPTLPEYYWWYSGYQPPARGPLRAETAHQIEAHVGFEEKEGPALHLRGYWYHVDDYVRTLFGYKPSRVVYNIERVILAGVEAEAAFRWKGLRVRAAYTWQYTRKYGDVLDGSSALSGRLVELPEHKALLGAELALSARFSAAVRLRLVSKRKAVLGNPSQPATCRLEDMDAFLDAAADLRYTFWEEKDGARAVLFASLSNLLDQEFEESYGYPAQGLAAQAGFRLRF